MSNNSKIQTINPATGKVISSYDIMSLDEIEHIAKMHKMLLRTGRTKKFWSAAITFETWPKYLARIRTDMPELLQKKWGNR